MSTVEALMKDHPVGRLADTFPVNLKEIVLSKHVFPRRPAFLLKLEIKNVCFKIPPFILFSALNLLHQLGGWEDSTVENSVKYVSQLA